MKERGKRKRNIIIKGLGERGLKNSVRTMGEDRRGGNKSRGDKKNRSREGKQEKDDNGESGECGRKEKDNAK